jgi:hypothetical protein
VNGKGLITAAGTVAVIAPAGTLTGTTLASNILSSSLTSVGTITSGTWNGSVVGSSYGGAGAISGILKANGSGTVSAAAAGTDYQAPITAGTGLTFSGSTLNSTWTTSGSDIYNNNAGNVGIGTTTPGSLLSIGTTNGINLSTATSTFNSTGGINLNSGCYAIGGNCLSYQTPGNYLTALTGDGTASGPGSAAFTLATVNSSVGTFNNVTVNGKGLVTSASNVSYLTGNQNITLSGDISGSGATSINATLATVNATTGSFGSSTAIPTFAVNAKGLITAAGTAAVVAPGGTLTGTALAPNVVSSSLTSVGTITSGTWNGTSIGTTYGGTGVSSFGGTNTLLYTSAASALTSLTTANSSILTTNASGVPNWSTTLPAYTLGGAVTGNSQAITGLSQLTVTGTTATSTFSTGGLTVGTSQFVVQQTSGNVGIGTTNPGTTLDVNGTFAARSTANAIFGNGTTGGIQVGDSVLTKAPGANWFLVGGLTTTGTSNFQSSLSVNQQVYAGYLTLGNGLGTAQIGADGTKPITFFPNNGGSEAMRIDSTGNVGIGTTTPGTILSIGNTGANTINISNTATSTFGTGINITSGCYGINGSCLSYQTPGNYITALTGDITASGPGSAAATLATVNSNTGSFGSSTAIPTFTANAKGLITAAGTAAVIAPAGTLTGTTLDSNVVSSSLTSVGTITSGTWNGTAIGTTYGGTGVSSFGGTNTLLYTSAANTLSSLATANSSILTTNGSGVPSWTTALPAFTLGGAVTGNSQNITGLNQLTVTGTTATSTFSTGGLTVGTSQFVVQQASGYVGIGTSTPSALLFVQGSADMPQFVVQANSTQTSTSNFVQFRNSAGSSVFSIATNGANTGQQFNAAASSRSIVLTGSGGNIVARSDGGIQWVSSTNAGGGTIDTGLSRYGVGILALGNGTAQNTSGTLLAGTIGIGTSSPASTLTVVGSACISKGAGATAPCSTTAGTITANVFNTAAADLAEDYPTSDLSLTAGDVVAVDPNNDINIVKATPGSSVIGIVSTQPGVLLGGSDASSTRPVALAGRVPVKVSMENGPILRGDELTVSSSTPGVAMKANPGNVVIGTALESAWADSSIIVFVRPGFAEGLAGSLAASSSASLAPPGNLLSSIGGWIENGIAHLKSLIVDQLTAKTVTVTGGLQMTSPDGTLYCVTIADGGAFTDTAGPCESPASSTPITAASTSPSSPTRSTASTSSVEITTPAPDIIGPSSSGPAMESPSASPTGTPTPSPTPSATPAATPELVQSPSPEARVTPSPAPAADPSAGSLPATGASAPASPSPAPTS